MASYYVEVIKMASNGRDWISRGFHERGSGTNMDDPLVFSGKDRALRMSRDFAFRRAELYRKNGSKARIFDSEGRIIVDFDQPLTEPQRFTRENSHRYWTYRGLYFIENCISGLWYHRFKWPFEDGEERSVSGGSPQEVIDRMFGMGGDIPQYLEANLDRIEQPQTPTSTEPPPQIVSVPLEPGQQVIGLRPGSIRI